MKHFVYILILFALLGSTACNDEIESNANNTNNTNIQTQTQKQIGEISDDADDLSGFVKLPFIPEDVSWQQLEVNGGKKVVAVIRFNVEDTAAILSQSQVGGKVELAAERWFPQELIAQSDIAGDQVLRGTIYTTNVFFKDAFNKGRVLKLDGSDYFIVELTNF
jgi:hypothetical protein